MNPVFEQAFCRTLPIIVTPWEAFTDDLSRGGMTVEELGEELGFTITNPPQKAAKAYLELLLTVKDVRHGNQSEDQTQKGSG